MPPDETVEHVVVEHEGEQPEAGAAETVVAAETAVALAGATAAAAELDAAERMRRLEMEGQEWRAGLSQELAGVTDSVRLLREVELSEMNAQRLALAENFRLLSERQERVEAQFQSLTRPESETETVAQTETENSPTLGTAAEVEAGPVSLGASLGADTENESPSPSAHPIRRRRWI